jgi:hypothetical protein
MLSSPVGGDDATWVELAQAFTAVAGLVVAALVAFMPYARRPKLSIEEDLDRIHSRVESSPAGGLPHVRVLVSDAQRRRAAHGTRVLLEGYRQQGKPDVEMTTLGHPSLGWPSAPETEATASAIVFAGGKRPITLGYFIRAYVTESGEFHDELHHSLRGPGHFALDAHYERDYFSAAWYFRLALAFGLDIFDNRDKLPPIDGGYAIRLLAGADDGAARVFEVDINWKGDGSLSPADVLASALERLHVRRI